MKKSLMMVSVCNPLMSLLQKRLYLKYWKDEVDELLIGVNGRNDRMRKFIGNLWRNENKVICREWGQELRQGYCFDLLYPEATGDIIITMDDDNFIYSKGVIDKYCKLLEKYSAVGSKGLHAYPVQNAQYIEGKIKTVRLNPFLSFWKKEIIEKTSKQKLFSTFNFETGIELAGIKMPTKGWLDAMGKLSVEYFRIAPNFYEISSNIEGEFIHFEGMSSIYRRFFRELENTNEEIIKEKKNRIFVNRNSSQVLPYWVKYWALYQTVKNDIPFADYKEKFEKLFDMNIKMLGIDKNLVEIESEKLRKSYPNLFI